MAKKSVRKSSTKTAAKRPFHHKVTRHLDKPVNTLLGYTVILLFLVVTLVVLASYM